MSSPINKTDLPPSTIDNKSDCAESDWKSTFSDEEIPKYELNGSPSLYTRFLNLFPTWFARRNTGDFDRYVYHYHAAPADEALESSTQTEAVRRKRRIESPKCWRWLNRAVLTIPHVVLCLFGVLHILLVLFGRKSLFWDLEEYELYLPNWSKIEDVGKALSSYPTDFTRNISPIPCHSHNDYWRRRPLFDAIQWGCTSVEVDVWHFNREDELFVGHNTASLSRKRTFKSLYVDPLVEVLDSMNPNNDFGNEQGHGVFDKDPNQTLVLLVDFKTNGHDLFPHVHKQLEPLRRKNYLSHWNGKDFISRAVTVVGTGNTPFDQVIESRNYRDIFFDAPLDQLWEAPRTAPDTRNQKRAASPGQGKTGIDVISSPDDFNTTNSYFASVSFTASIGYPWRGYLTEEQLDLIRGQIEGAQRRGLKARYWETPTWPTSLRNRIWEVLVKEGADILNVDDLKSAAALDWTEPVRHTWFDA